MEDYLLTLALDTVQITNARRGATLHSVGV